MAYRPLERLPQVWPADFGKTNGREYLSKLQESGIRRAVIVHRTRSGENSEAGLSTNEKVRETSMQYNEDVRLKNSDVQSVLAALIV